MFEIFDMLFRFVIMPTILLICLVVLAGLVYDFVVGATWNTNVNDILGYEDDDEETIRM